jgi:hypothetical protein
VRLVRPRAMCPHRASRFRDGIELPDSRAAPSLSQQPLGTGEGQPASAHPFGASAPIVRRLDLAATIGGPQEAVRHTALVDVKSCDLTGCVDELGTSTLAK